MLTGYDAKCTSNARDEMKCCKIVLNSNPPTKNCEDDLDYQCVPIQVIKNTMFFCSLNLKIVLVDIFFGLSFRIVKEMKYEEMEICLNLISISEKLLSIIIIVLARKTLRYVAKSLPTPNVNITQIINVYLPR